ncbi:MAG: hypothetical protein SGJ13_01275 [Actinomycetota bacterium]|nr:hypothetical protein [Actinomycetota bacterium]
MALALVSGLAACGGDDDDDDAATDETTAEADDATDETTDETTAEAEEAASPYCALALEMFGQDSFPTPDQLEQAQELAPAEIAEQVAIAVPALAATGEDSVAFFNAFAEDDVEEAIEDINEFENVECGTEHEPASDEELDPAAARVDVNAVDYEFEFTEPIAAGPTSFVLTNTGAEAHFLLVLKLAEGVTLDQALESEDDTSIEGEWTSGLAAPGGEDEEVVNVELEPGNYGMLCFVSDADGTPHATLGMAQEFTVS